LPGFSAYTNNYSKLRRGTLIGELLVSTEEFHQFNPVSNERSVKEAGSWVLVDFLMASHFGDSYPILIDKGLQGLSVFANH